MMSQVVALWNAEGDWPARVQANVCRSLGVESLDGAFRHAPRPPIVNGKKTPEPQGDWAVMFKSMQEEQAKMREEMVRERVQQESRMRTMVGRLEQVEEELDKSVKRRDEVEDSCLYM
ncbi:hypothetical protein AG1IA_10465 [Rhizoctonia solani AG-1 IA]|uniref:Uncharacterized protein n=1 Tax=Thanatephorus cucumeris (strain AG1-IA) TaxID=983506 RepID=L8WC15_THACA|nr:hypothetical protein AG1IA_10465 [Rhizoctonia solani AG-1 IA]